MPVVHPAEFDVAIAYLIRRLEESASQDNFMSAVFDLGEIATLFEREQDASSPPSPSSTTGPRPMNRIQNRALQAAPLPHGLVR